MPDPTTRKSAHWAIQAFVWAVLLASIGGFVAYLGNQKGPPRSPVPLAQPKPDLGNAGGAWEVIQTCVTKELKSPTSASFPMDGWTKVRDLGDGLWAVDSHVDAVNAFNAELRTHFYCSVRKVEGGWILDKLRFIDR